MKPVDLNILVVDDVDASVQALVIALQSLGVLNILTSNSTDIAKNILQKSFENNKPIHLILCDHHMPGKAGHDFINFVRMNMTFRDVGYITVTSDARRAVIVLYISAGADSFIVKPVNSDELKTKMTQVLKAHGIQLG